MHRLLQYVKKWTLLCIILIMLALFWYYDGSKYLNLEQLQIHRNSLLAWRDNNYFLSYLITFIIYVGTVAASIPGAAILTLICGFLFGPIWGSVLVVCAATLGALIINLAVHLAFREWWANKAAGPLKKMESGFNQNPFSYLLFLRLVPLFPFWLVNIVPSLLGVSIKTFAIATFIGIIPGTIVYTLMGNGLGYLIDSHKELNLGIIFQWPILLPLLGLGCLALIPVLYSHCKRRH